MRRLAAIVPLLVLAGCFSGTSVRQKELEAQKFQASQKELQDQLAQAQKSLAAAQTELEGLRGQLAAKSGEAASLKDQLARKEAEVAELKGDVAALKTEVTTARAQADELSSTKQQLQTTLEKKSSEYDQLASSLKEEISAGRVELTELRGKMTVKMKDKILFSSGSAAIGKPGLAALQAVADALKNVSGKTIRVEGHTDNVPAMRSKFASNWELSTARALAVVRFLQVAGVDPAKLAAAGYGEYQPVAPNDSADGRSQNRRIEIVLAPADGAPAPMAAK
jgi:chemotaxis protein MotB